MHRDLSTFDTYADYMQAPQFEESLRKLIETASERRTAIMCAEAVPWRCHGSLVADALTVRGVAVEHTVGKSGSKPHANKSPV